MAKLHIDKQESEFLNDAITHWEKDGIVTKEQAETMRNSYEVKGFDWMRLAKYSFWIALVCGGASFTFLITLSVSDVSNFNARSLSPIDNWVCFKRISSSFFLFLERFSNCT